MPELGAYFRHRDWDAEIVGRGIGATAAKQIADRVRRIPHKTYVEPFLGRGDIFRAVAPKGRAILNDLDCKRIVQAKRASCSVGNRSRGSDSCVRLTRDAQVECGKDWRQFLRYDSPSTLFVLDPPWAGVPDERMNYRERKAISAQEVADATRGLQGSVAVAYKDDAPARQALCRSPFRSSKIHKNFFGRPFTQLLAVKPAGAT